MLRLTPLFQKLHNAARILEHPEVLNLKFKGGMMDLYFEFQAPWLQNLEIATILDIGANTGHFSITMKEVFPKAQIYAFEPLPDCYDQLVKRMEHATNFQSFNLALGEQSDQLTFFKSESAPASSLLQMTDMHKLAFPKTAQISEIEVSVKPLDEIAHQLQFKYPLFIKIDVQGFEKQVLLGGMETIAKAKIILIETSFETLYEDQALFDELYHLLSGWGFRYHGSLFQHRDPQHGRILQSDSVFIKQ